MKQAATWSEILLVEATESDFGDRLIGSFNAISANHADLAAAEAVLRACPNHLGAQMLFGLCALTFDDQGLMLTALRHLADGDMTPVKRWVHSLLITRVSNNIRRPRRINVGGTLGNEYVGWNTYELEQSPLNRWPLRFETEKLFAETDSSCDLVYSSHFLQDLDDVKVANVLREVSRVLDQYGYFVLKLPDWQTAVERALSSDWSWFNLWGMADLAKSWPNRGLKESPFAYAAMIHCGYFTASYLLNSMTSESNSTIEQIKGYHGPAILLDEDYLRIFDNRDPRVIAQILRDSISEDEDYFLNHRNAWSATDLISLVESFGFLNIEATADEIVEFMSDVPRISDSKYISSFFLFEKRRS